MSEIPGVLGAQGADADASADARAVGPREIGGVRGAQGASAEARAVGPREIKGDLHAGGRRFGVVAARFNEIVTRRLLDGALAALRANGVADDDVDVAWVPGAFELPVAARRMAASGTYDGVICLGAVIRGETAHFDHVAREAASGIRAAAEATGVPVTFGVLTTDTLEQALDRAGGDHGNKGWDAATAAIETASLLEQLPKEA